MKIYFFEIEDWERLYIEKVIREKGLQADIEFFKEPLNKSIIDKIKDAEAISVFIYSKITKDIIDSLPNLKMIVTRSAGYDHIDIEYANQKGIIVSNVPGYGDNTVAEYTFALILALARKLKPMIERTSKGIFSREGLTGIDIMGKTIGILGTGRIGSHVVKIAHGFGMKILAYDRTRREDLIQKYGVEYVGLEDLLMNADIITIHLPYNKSTHYLINKFNIKLTKLDAMLVNTSRGSIVELEAIVEALKEGRLAGGVALDTVELEEVLPEEEELKRGDITAIKIKKAIDKYFVLQSENVIISPHIAYSTKDALHRILDITVENLFSCLVEGKPKNVVSKASC